MSDAVVNGVAGACGGMIAQLLTYPLQAVNTRQQVRRKLLKTESQLSSEARSHCEGPAPECPSCSAALLQPSSRPDPSVTTHAPPVLVGCQACSPERRAGAADCSTCSSSSSDSRSNAVDVLGGKVGDGRRTGEGEGEGLISGGGERRQQGRGQRREDESRGREAKVEGPVVRSGRPGRPSAPASSSSSGLVDCALEMWQIARAEGVGALYRGLQPSLVGTVCSQGVYYYFYQLFRDKAEALAQQSRAAGQGSGQVSLISSLIVAALAGCVNVLLTNPIWIIVTRMQTQSSALQPAAALSMITGKQGAAAGTGKGVGRAGAGEGEAWGASAPSAQKQNAVRGFGDPKAAVLPDESRLRSKATLGAIGTTVELFEEAGLLGFWKGVLPTLIMVSNPAIQFAVYESLMARITARRPRLRGGAKSASAWEIFLVGALAKLGATVLTYPLLVVKSRLQARITHPSSRYSGTVDALGRIVMEEGLWGLYKGMGTKIVQSVFAASVLFLTKEELVKLVRFLIDRRERLRSAQNPS